MGVTWSLANGAAPRQNPASITEVNLADLKPRQKIVAAIAFPDGKTLDIELLCRIDTEEEMSYYRNGGILPFVLRNLASAA